MANFMLCGATSSYVNICRRVSFGSKVNCRLLCVCHDGVLCVHSIIPIILEHHSLGLSSWFFVRFTSLLFLSSPRTGCECSRVAHFMAIPLCCVLFFSQTLNFLFHTKQRAALSPISSFACDFSLPFFYYLRCRNKRKTFYFFRLNL